MELLENLPVQNKKINLKKEAGRYLKKWYWFVFSLAVFLAAATLYLRYAQKQYLSKTTLRFYESKNQGVSASALSDLKALGMGVSGNEELITETSVIVSKPILEKVVRNLSLQVRVYNIGRVKEMEAYHEAPFRVEITEPDLDFGGAEYTLSPVGVNSFKLSGLQGIYRFGVVHRFPFGKANFIAKPAVKIDSDYKVEIASLKNAVTLLENRITAQIPQNKGMVMELSMVGPVPKRTEDILNELSRQYNIDGVNDKNQEALNTQKFITERLAIITNDLLGVENQKEGFKRQNQIADLEAQAQLSLQNASENAKEIASYKTQLDLINTIYGSAAASDERLLPSNLGLPASTEALIGQYNDLVITRNKTLKQATNANPAVGEMNREISSIKNLIRRNLSDTRANLAGNIARLQQQVSSDRAKISRFPTQEKVFRSIDRELNLKEQLYLFLLQKREENAITLAVTAPKAKVLNPAYTVSAVKPNSKQVMLGALGAGLLLPLLLLYGKFSLDTKVHGRDDITDAVPDATVLSEIPENEDGSDMIQKNDFSVFAESFRILASNLKFMLKTKNISNGAVMLITSSVKGEGKTTVSMNTALTLASNSRVIIVGADIRNPQLKRFGTDQKALGLTEYLVSVAASPAQFVTNSGLSENLDIMHSGTIPPNPTDLLEMPKFRELIAQLREQYQYILIDSAPVMLVSDTLHLVDVADLLLYVVKSDYTEKEMLAFADTFRKENHLKNMVFVLNGVTKEHSRYGKKYAYGYYHERKKSGINRFF